MGRLKDSHIWLPEGAGLPESNGDLRRVRPSLMRACAKRHDKEDEAFLWESLMAEVATGVADPPVEAHILDQRYGRDVWLPTPCSVHTQASDKRRRIDNARRSGKTRLTSRSERFTFNSTLAPAIAVMLIFSVAENLGPEVLACIRAMSFQSGG